jgi:1-deoxy-D-xylulose-5-phosphate reductoisomerase
VAAFIDGRLPYLDIVGVVEKVLAEHTGTTDPSLEDIEAAESWARVRAREVVETR